MFLIYCPHCQEERAEEEFHQSGEAHLPRPAEPDLCTDKEWGQYLFFRKNPYGVHKELWQHTIGCRQYFNITRDTGTYEIYGSYKIGEKPSEAANESD